MGKRPRGRPIQSPEGKRDTVLAFKCLPSEAAAYREAATGAGLGLSAWLRQLAGRELTRLQRSARLTD